MVIWPRCIWPVVLAKRVARNAFDWNKLLKKEFSCDPSQNPGLISAFELYCETCPSLIREPFYHCLSFSISRDGVCRFHNANYDRSGQIRPDKRCAVVAALYPSFCAGLETERRVKSAVGLEAT